MSEEASYSILTFPARNLPKAYEALVFSKWLKSLRSGNDTFKLTDTKAYFAAYHAYIEALLKRETSWVRLAVLSDDHDVVLGFLVHRGEVLDYVFVHRDYRKLGIAKSLLPKGITTFSHLTKTAHLIWKQKYNNLIFNLFA